MVYAITENGSILLRFENRYAFGKYIVKGSAEMLKMDDETLTAAMRELLKEMEYSFNYLTSLCPTFESTSMLTNTLPIFLAIIAVPSAAQQFEPNEHHDVMKDCLEASEDFVMVEILTRTKRLP